MFAYRVAWELIHGPIPAGLLICHHCDNPQCVRPDHLFLGTHKDNQQDKVKKGRAAIGKTWGEKHPWVKLSNLQVRAIFTLRRLGWPISHIAKAFRISNTHARRLLKGDGRAHLRAIS